MKTLGIVGGGVSFGINAVTQPFFALYAVELGASTATVGFLLMVRAILPLIIAMPAGELIDRLGAPHMLRAGNLLTIVSLAMMGFSDNLTVITLAQLLIGAATMVVASSLQVIVSEGDKAARERNITRYSAWSSGGTMIGPLIGGGVVTLVTGMSAATYFTGSAAAGYRSAFLFSLVVAILYGIAFHFASREFRSRSKLGKELKSVLRPKEMAGSYMQGVHLIKHPGIQFGLVGTFLIHFIQSIWQGFFPLYLNTLGFGAFVISVLISLRGLAGMLSRLFVGQLVKRWSHQTLLIAAGCGAAICLSALPFSNWNAYTIGAVAFLLGSAVGINMPVSTMIMVDEDSMADRGKIMGLRLLVNRGSQIAAPALFGFFGQLIGLSAAFVASGGLLLVSMLGFSLYRKTRFRPQIPINHAEVEKL
ncbi:MFS transporter [Cohnella cellulosilytica]|uniref:MFS transporter n=1 Tax=Cohnella cellulosilytica TaxID=986710 RepID=A0ABW2FEZ0_9BACL